MIGLPVISTGAAFRLGALISRPDPLISGVSLLAASLVAVFVQLAVWRAKLTDRAKAAERPARRSIDEAVGHTLVSAVVSLGLAVLMAILSNILPPDGAEPSKVVYLLWRALSSLAIGTGVYLLAAFVLVINLLWDAYDRDKDLRAGAAGTAHEPSSGATG